MGLNLMSMVSSRCPSPNSVCETSTISYYIQSNVIGEIFQSALERVKITQIYCDSTSFDHSEYRKKVDLIFVDASHEYDSVRSDSEKALEMLASGGVILWHDYVFSHYGVYAWLNELSHTIDLFSIPNTTLVYHHRKNNVEK